MHHEMLDKTIIYSLFIALENSECSVSGESQ